jgi:glycosyltransferase involved in cell wall biosynthesis
VAEHLRWADVFCLPSIVEGSATSTYEALAAGLPIITTPNAGSLVCDGEEGWIVEAGNAEPLIKTFQRIIDSPEEIDQRRNNIKRANSAALEESALSAPWSQAAYGARLVETIRAISA